MPLNLNGPSTQEKLKQLETTGANKLEATVDEQGIEAEVSHETRGWRLAAYVKRLWKGKASAGARVTKDF